MSDPQKTTPPTAPNIAYAASGGFRFEFDQVRKIGMALTALETQWQSRATGMAETSAMIILKAGLANLRKAIADSRDQPSS